MIETEVPPGGDGLSLLPVGDLAARITATHAALLEHETTVLQLACAWADVHDIDSTDPHYRPLIERACVFGGPGTPEVSEHCVAEFGALQGLGSWAARQLIGDALDLRHRLPELWRLVQAGAVRAWSARKVAQATRALSWDACRDVDRAVSALLPLLPWGRFTKILQATILEHDPAAAKERAERALVNRDVWATDSDDGLKLLIVKAASGDVAFFMAAVNRVAGILARRGDSDPVGARRAKAAVGILAQPAYALQLLRDHQHDPDRGPTSSPGTTVEDEEVDRDRSPSPEPAPNDAPADPTDQPEPNDEDRQWAHNGRDHGPEPVDEEDTPVEPADRSLDLAGSPFQRGDAATARPKIVLYFHLSDASLRDGLGGNVRPEHGDLLTLDQLHAFLADTGCPITVKPVIDPAAVAPVDGYEIPTRVREAARLRQIADVFPYATNTSRSMDLDHTVPYQTLADGGPPGQTGVGKLGPHGRSNHRTKTHSPWQGTTTRPGHVPASDPDRLHLPGHQPGHPQPRQDGVRARRLGCGCALNPSGWGVSPSELLGVDLEVQPDLSTAVGDGELDVGPGLRVGMLRGVLDVGEDVATGKVRRRPRPGSSSS